jgi:hypothetical protein
MIKLDFFQSPGALSYDLLPENVYKSSKDLHYFSKLAGAVGLEPTTLGFGDRCSTN